jgi:putative two-component system protein, hydrogenase maturation factor HypX/HoxX
VIAGLRGNAGAGGAMLALAADYVYAREGVVLNPHYRSMGGLFGSEYRTYTLPRRVGRATAAALTEECRPIGTREAKKIGFIDDSFGGDAAEFERNLRFRAVQLSKREDFWRLLREKHERRIADERARPLAIYRAKELAHMRANFYDAGQKSAVKEDKCCPRIKRILYKGATIVAWVNRQKNPLVLPRLGPLLKGTEHKAPT